MDISHFLLTSKNLNFMAQGDNENWKFYGAICVVVFIVLLCISPLYTIGIFWILATICSMVIH